MDDTAKGIRNAREFNNAKKKLAINSIISLHKVRENKACDIAPALEQGLGRLDGNNSVADLATDQEPLLLIINKSGHSGVQDVGQSLSEQPIDSVEKSDSII